MMSRIVSRLLTAYRNRDFATQELARFTLFTTLGYTVILTLLVLYTFILYALVPVKDQYSISTLIFLSSSFGFVCYSLYLIYRGYFQFATHLVFSSSFALIWLIMWTDSGDLLATFDTVVFVFAMFALLPLLVRRIWLIVLYLLVNAVVACFFVFRFKEHFALSTMAVRDFISDTGFSMLIIAFGSYSVFVINERILKRSISEAKNRSEAEEALLKSERRFSDLTNMLPQPVYETDQTGRLIYANANAFQTFGYAESDLTLGLKMSDLVVLEDRVKAEKNIQQIIQGALPNGNFYMGLRKDGSVFPVQIFTNLIIEEGAFKGFRGVIVDVTDRVAVEEELKASRDQFLSLVSNIPGAAYRSLFDEHWTMLYISEDIERITGYPKEDFINNAVRSFGSIIFHEDNLKLDQIIIDAIRDNLTWEVEYRIVHKNGDIKWVSEKGRAISNDENQVVFFDGIIVDITERKQQEEALRLSELRYRTIIEAYPDIILLQDRDGNILFGNQPFKDITGIVEADYNNLNRAARVFPDDLPIFNGTLDSIINSNQTHSDSIEFRFVNSNGDILWLSAIISKMIMNGQEVYQIICRDISYKKEIEDELQSYRHHLEALVQKRTQEFERANSELAHINSEQIAQRKELEDVLSNLKDAQNRLIQSEKMASLGVLVAGIAHEINNPLNFINAGAIGLDGYINDNLKEYADDLNPLLYGIQEGVKRAADIVTSLSHYSRRTDNLFVQYDLHSIIDNALVMLQSQIKSRIDVVKQYYSEPLLVNCNEGRLHQVFLNILANSVQSISDTGTITILTSIDNGFVVVRISDTGCGIHAEALSKITDPFYTTKPPGKGTGLGLSISYNIILEHQGTLRFISQPNQGTTAIITLPTI